MTILPRRRSPQRSGIREIRREFPRHRKFVRSHSCCVPGCEGRPIVFAHVRSAANAGVALKPADWHGISLCDECHREQHQIGQAAFERKHGIDMATLAAAFVRASPDTAMKEAIRMSDDVRALAQPVT
jgi:hypothetical protein